MELKNIELIDVDIAYEIINTAKKHLKEQGIDQWQTGYPDYECIKNDALNKTGYFFMDNDLILGYLCIDFSGEPAYESLNGNWSKNSDYVVVHRMAFTESARGKKLSNILFKLIEEMSLKRNINYLRVDTDEDNLKMQHVLKKNGFTFCGTICFDNSEKIAFDKVF